MNTRTEVQIIHGKDGAPAFVVMPYADWLAGRGREQALVPNEVVNFAFDHDWTPMRAWREHLGLTQAEVATRIGSRNRPMHKWRMRPTRARPHLKKSRRPWA